MKNEKNIAVMFALRPKWTMLIANHDKTIEVRSSFCYEWAKKQIEKFGGFYGYIYCTKGKPYCFQEITYEALAPNELVKHPFEINNYCPEPDTALNGKVVGRFWCNDVEKLFIQWGTGWTTESGKLIEQIEKESHVGRFSLYEYLGGKGGYAIHITDVKMFDEPKELRDFMKCCDEFKDCLNCKNYTDNKNIPECRRITRAPQSWCYTEVIKCES